MQVAIPSTPLVWAWPASGVFISTKGLLTREAGRGHATPHMPVEMAKCWWLLKIEPNVWAGGNGICAVCVGLQAVGALEFFGESYSLAKGFGPFLRGVWAGFREREGSIFSNHQHFAVSSLQAYAELHALSPLRGSISPCQYRGLLPLAKCKIEMQLNQQCSKLALLSYHKLQ